MVKIIPSAENAIFALDIGTRTVLGIVVLVESGKLRIVAQHLAEHAGRAMFDGQIHDIPMVAETVLEVKRVLEKKVGFPLGSAAIAAAGRALLTKQCRAEMELNEQVEIESIVVNSLEIAVVRRAYQELEAAVAANREKYLCVGYSVVRYFLDDYPVTNLVGHRGKNIAAEIIATFLPESVVNSLYAVLARVGLDPIHITLEPIAAIEVLIPENMRLLNLALIDIGAGTSDIAITRKGAVVAYGMAPVAGDEITENLAENLLVDFNWAEKIKKALAEKKEIVYKDVLGLENRVMPEEALVSIEPGLNKLAEELAGVILELNGGEPPKTVFCVGGGARIPELKVKLAERLGLPAAKVAVRGREAVPDLTVDEEGLEGPEGVTVVGIAATAVKKLGHKFIAIKVDGKDFRLFNSKELNVARALSQLDFNPRDLIGRNGKDLRFKLNGKDEVVYGGFAEPAEIQINGQKANLQSPIMDRDEIRIFKAGFGGDAAARVGDYLRADRVTPVIFNGSPATAQPKCFINGRPAVESDQLNNGDQLEIQGTVTLGDFLAEKGLTAPLVLINGHPAESGYILRENDQISLAGLEQPELVWQGLALPESDRTVGNNPPADPGEGAARPEFAVSPGLNREREQVKDISVMVNGEKVVLSGAKGYIFVDLFNHIEVNPADLTEKPVLTLNGVTAGFTDVLSDGDVIEMVWK